MKQLFYTLAIALSLYAGSAFATDSVTDPAKQLAATEAAVKEVSVSEVSVKQVQQFLKTKTANVVILDANNDSARGFAGVVPGAILLSSYNEYALTELPKDKNTTLVFYCYNSYCQASHAAAQRAIFAGYKDARVMKAGIMGWNKANPKI